MLKEAKDNCDYLIVGLQNDPTLDRPEKNAPIQSIVERQIQLAAIKYVDEVVIYNTEQDLEELPEGMRIRLVIGIYKEPSEIAQTEKPDMKDRMLVLAERLLERGHYVEFATHDVVYVRRFLEEVVPRVGVGRDRYEVQMLYGVPRDRFLADLNRQGVKARLYVPFALSWDLAIEYLRRRLDEYPAMMWLVTKNMIWRS